MNEDGAFQQEQLFKVATLLEGPLAQGVARGITESRLLKRLVEVLMSLGERVDQLEEENRRIRTDLARQKPLVLPSSALVIPPNRPAMMINRGRSRLLSRPTVTYRHDPRTAAGSDREEVCSEPGCERPARSRGLCAMHYQRERYRERKIEHKNSNSDPLPPPPPPFLPGGGQPGHRRQPGGTRGVFALLYEEKGRKTLAGLINQMKYNRCDLVQRLNELHQGMPGVPLDEEDVVRCVHYHELGEAMKKKEAEIICRHLSKQRGSLAKTAQNVKMEPSKLEQRIRELELEEETTRIRSEFREEILERSSFNHRLDLALTREKYLKDLGIEAEVDESLKKELEEHICRLAEDLSPEEAGTTVRESLALDEERFQRLLKRFNLELTLETLRGAAAGGG